MKFKRKGILFIFSAPSGAGKTSIIKELLKKQNDLEFSVSVTSRSLRPNEIDGESYWFVSRNKFDFMIENNEFAEWAEVHGNYYGTPHKNITDCIDNGKDIVLDIDVQGGRSIKKQYFENSVMIFILPPSFKELEDRLRERKTDNPNVIEKRLENARNEMNALTGYDYFFINDDLDAAVSKALKIIYVERMKIKYYNIDSSAVNESVIQGKQFLI